MVTIDKKTTLPVMEIFGPTLQGEGKMMGQRTHFIRFGGCDYSCSWCDSMFAVKPELVKRYAKHLQVDEIVSVIQSLGLAHQCPWVTLSGGNPALHHLEGLVALLRQAGYKLCLETQGTIRRVWADDLELTTVSPKPPSSGQQVNYAQLDKWMTAAVDTIIKVVVFDEEDLNFAADIAERYPYRQLYLQPGTDVIGDVTSAPTGDDPDDHVLAQTRQQVCDKLLWVHNAALAHDRIPRNVIIMPQMHVLMWGQKQGV